MPARDAASEHIAEVERSATLGSAVTSMTRAFADAGLDTPALDARRLVLFALALEPVALLREPERTLTPEERHRLASVTARRLMREPVSRIEGRRAFHGLDLEIGPATLDPRPDTETLVEAAIELMRDHPAPRILDLGTGSGAILLAVLHQLPNATGVGTDISDGALAIAQRNAIASGLGQRAVFLRATWLEGLAGAFDLVVSNPPYIARDQIPALDLEVRGFDPVGALDGGPDGLDAYRAIAKDVRGVLNSGGWVAVEVGAGQADDVAGILRSASGASAAGEGRIWRDLSGLARCVAIQARV